MPSTWSVEDGSRSCPHCGARYKVTVTGFPFKDHDWIDCHTCKQRIEWNDTASPSNWRLITGEA